MSEISAASNSYIIRTMTREDLDIAVNWAAAEGWNPGLYDADAFYAVDPTGFLIAYINDKPIATISVVNYDNHFGFLGFYIVTPEFRGKGYGLRIWNAGIEYLKDLNIGLDGVISQQENYKKSGFYLAYRNIRYEGIADGKLSKNVVPVDSLDFDSLADYDSNLFPAKRTKFLEKWIKQPQATAYAVMDNNGISGYGVIRKCRTGYKIGPLFADDFQIAEELLLSLVANIHGEKFYLDVPEINPYALKLVNNFYMSKVFETARMYKGKIPNVDLSRIFGVTTFELG